MHELGIVFHIIKQVEDVCKKNQVSSVASVTMQFGEVSGIVPEYLEDCWKWAAAKSSFLQDAKLVWEKLAAVTICNDCSKTYSTLEHGKICPNCGGQNTELLSGNEIIIKEIAVKETP